jgi:KDO2-lipid IV(A) lauroyltransferase
MSRIDTRIQTIKDLLTYLIVRIVVCVIQALPISVCQRVARWSAFWLVRKSKRRANVIDENLQATYPTWTPEKRRQVAQDMWEHLILMICEIAHAPRKIHQTNWRKFVSIPDRKQLVAALTDTRPLVMVAGHYGNFEIGGYIAGLLGFPTYTVARTLDNRFLDAYLNRFRQLNGQHTLPKEGSAKLVDQVMRQGGNLCLLGDQHAGSAGVWVNFMGRQASCHKALALFTLTGGAPMLVSYARRTDKPMQFDVGVQGYADPNNLSDTQHGVRQLTQWYNDRLEEIIRAQPDQYWWLHRRWREKPVRRKKRKRQAA